MDTDNTFPSLIVTDEDPSGEELLRQVSEEVEDFKEAQELGKAMLEIIYDRKAVGLAYGAGKIAKAATKLNPALSMLSMLPKQTFDDILYNKKPQA